MRASFKLGLAASLLVLASSGISANELAVLKNGFTIKCERRELRAEMTRLYFAGASGGYVDIPTEDIAAFETEEIVPPPPAATPTVTAVPITSGPMSLGEMVQDASQRNRVDAELILSVIRAESAFRSDAVSPKGAQGLMQLMPQTAAQLGVRDALDPAANVEGGTKYLRQLLDRYNNDLIKALAAYNAGPEHVDQYRGVPPYSETRAYLVKVINDFNRHKQARLQGGREQVRKVETARDTQILRSPAEPARNQITSAP
jgi:soluble lytic murein transglycosylase-like protein